MKVEVKTCSTHGNLLSDRSVIRLTGDMTRQAVSNRQQDILHMNNKLDCYNSAGIPLIVHAMSVKLSPCLFSHTHIKKKLGCNSLVTTL